MAKICPIFSSSSANSTYISTPSGSVLVDVGASCKSVCETLSLLGCEPTDIAAVAVTHEHIDHVKGLKLFLKKSGARLIAGTKTLEVLATDDRIPEGTEVIAADEGDICIGDMLINRFSTSHDCEGSSGYTISVSGKKIAAVCTDLGIVTDGVREALKGFPAIVFESNHDIEMLRRGPYPPQLKLRILSEKGHLSNIACAAELGYFLKNGTSRFVLAHLSRNNNLPMLALSSARAALADIGAVDGSDYLLSVAKPTGNEVIPL